MTTSNPVYVWAWLSGHAEPVVAGAVEFSMGRYRFYYAQSYLQRPDAISLYRPELPLRQGYIDPVPGLRLAGCLRDALPDAWGRNVIQYRLTRANRELSELDYMLLSGSNRFGALDFQKSSDAYVPRNETASLDELHEAAHALEQGLPLSETLKDALEDGTSIGGARPKVLVSDAEGQQWIAKLSSTSDRIFSVVNAEAAVMELASRCDIRVPETRVTTSLGRDVLLVKRFDRSGIDRRQHVVSGLTMAGESELGGRYVTYPAILRTLREYSQGDDPGLELFERIVFNIATSNNDDHARNHAAFWDGLYLTLTPAFDLAPGSRTGDTSQQALAFDSMGLIRTSSFAAAVSCAGEYGLSFEQANSSVDRIVTAIRENWDDAADIGRLSQADKQHLWGHQILNDAVFYDTYGA